MNNERISKCSSGKKGNLLPPCYPRTVWAVGAVAPTAPVAPAPLFLSHLKHEQECFIRYKTLELRTRVLCLIKHDNERILIRMNPDYIIILVRMNNYIMPHGLSDIKSLHVTYYG